MRTVEVERSDGQTIELRADLVQYVSNTSKDEAILHFNGETLFTNEKRKDVVNKIWPRQGNIKAELLAIFEGIDFGVINEENAVELIFELFSVPYEKDE